MQIRQHDIDKDLLILEASDEINDDQAEEMVNNLEADINAGKHHKVVVDCGSLAFLSSFGLGMIMRLRTAAKNVNGEMKLAGVNAMIEAMLRKTKMDRHFMIYPDVEQARASFHLRPM